MGLNEYAQRLRQKPVLERNLPAVGTVRPLAARARLRALLRPHHVPKEWADKYHGKFDDAWDAYREKTFARQKKLGIVPPDAQLSRHDPDVQVTIDLSGDLITDIEPELRLHMTRQ